MSDKILITYASRLDSTAGVAQAIGETLSQAGLAVEVLPMQEVTDLTPYQAVIAGSAIHGKAWLPEAMQFVQKNQAALAQKPFAAFLVCLTLAMKNPSHHAAVKEWLAPIRKLVSPMSEGYFAGVLDIKRIPSWLHRLKFRLAVALGVWTEGDHRDWDAIRAWAQGLKL